MSRIAAVLAGAWLAAATPALASDWHYVGTADDRASIFFIDKDSIRAAADGNTNASMYAVLAAEQAGAAAYFFDMVIDCRGRRSRLISGEAFGPDRKSLGREPATNEWTRVKPNSQGEMIASFICTKGANSSAERSVGSVLSFERARQMLAQRTKEKN